MLVENFKEEEELKSKKDAFQLSSYATKKNIAWKYDSTHI